MSTFNKLAAIQRMNNSFLAKRDAHGRKQDRARLTDRVEYHYQKYCLYNQLAYRAGQLYQSVKSTPESKSYIHSIVRTSAWETRLERKEKGYRKWKDLHKYSMWFMSNSIGADYGTYTCDRCGDTFHHSPSTITKAIQEVYTCCCGTCTNQIILKDWGSQPYQY